MFECQKCGRRAGREILLCPEREHGNCTFKVAAGPLWQNQFQAAVFMVGGLLILWFSVYSAPLFFQPEGLFQLILHITFVTLSVLGALYVAGWGLVLYKTEKLTVYSDLEGKYWQTLSVLGYEYRVNQIMTVGWSDLPVAVELTFSPEFLVLSKEPQTALYLDLLQNCSRAKFSQSSQILEALEDTETVAEKVLEAAVFELVLKGVVRLAKVQIYETAAKAFANRRSYASYLVCRGQTDTANLALGAVAERLYTSAKQLWDTQPQSQLMLAPSLRNLILASFPDSKRGLAFEVLACAIDSQKGKLLDASGTKVNATVDLLALDRERKDFWAALKRYNVANVPHESLSKQPSLLLKAMRLSMLGWRSIFVFEERRRALSLALILAALVMALFLRYSNYSHRVSEFNQALNSLQSQDEAERRAGLKKLYSFKSSMPQPRYQKLLGPTIASLTHWFKLADPTVRAEILAFISDFDSSKLKGFAEANLRDLLKELRASEAHARASSAKLLSLVDNAGIQVVSALIAALSDSSADVRSAAAESLGRFLEHPNEIIPALERSLSDPNSAVRRSASQSLDELKAQAAGEMPNVESWIQRQEQSFRDWFNGRI